MTNAFSNIAKWVVSHFVIIAIGTIAVLAGVKGSNSSNFNNQNIVVNNPADLATTTGATTIGPHDYTLPDGRGFYSNPNFSLSFVYPSGWVLEEANIPEHGGHGGASILGLRITGPGQDEMIQADVLNREEGDLDSWSDDRSRWYNNIVPTNNNPLPLYAWVNDDYEVYAIQSAGLIIPTEKYIYSVEVESSPSMTETAFTFFDNLEIGDLDVGSSIPSGFIENLKVTFPVFGQNPVALDADNQYCAHCNETDTYTNVYRCSVCTYGNCTWKCEQARPQENFGFGTDAYKWLTSEADFGGRPGVPYVPLGGTIPKVGAVIVYKDTISPTQPGRGHVATITLVNTDGSVNVREQNCTLSCTIDRTRSGSYLNTYRAGYIYNGVSAPFPTPKEISGTFGEVTVIDDYNPNSSIYNFGTYGPGAKMFGGNRGERYWGVETTGLNGCLHYIKTQTGSPENSCIWAFKILAAGVYEVHAYIPNSTKADATSVSYQVGGFRSIPINQQTNRGRYVRLVNPTRSDGNWSFVTGATSEVDTGDGFTGGTEQIIAIDAIRFKRVS